MNKHKIKDNILIQYTVISLLLTIILASILSWLISVQLKDQLIFTHGDFYSAYIAAIDKNYSEIIPLIIADYNNLETSHIEDPNTHDHQSLDEKVSSPDNLVWLHFKSDLTQFPFVKNFRILDQNNEIIWKYKTEDSEEHLDTMFIENIVSDDRKTNYQIIDFETYFAIRYQIPIIIDGERIGTAEILDIDPSLRIKISQTQSLLIKLIFLGGLIFYSSLFLLFYKFHLKQTNTIVQLDRSQSLTVHTMSKLAELRDDNTGSHIKRTSLYCKVLGIELSRHEPFSSYITHAYIIDLERSAPLHDIGKVGVPDNILQKPGPLSNEEFEIIKTHPLLGAKVLLESSQSLGFQSYFEIAYQIALHHHENWDGSGYPDKLAQEEIPLSARIMSIADVYDALTTSRPYKSLYSHEKAIRIITEESGKKFDPRIVEILLIISDQFEEIAKKFSDTAID